MPATERSLPSSAPGLGLPSVATTKSGLSYDPRKDVWDWVDGPFRMLIRFDALPCNFRRFTPQLKSCLIVFCRGYSPAYVVNMFQAFAHFARANVEFNGDTASISPREIACYGATLNPSQSWRVGALNPLLQKWFHLGLEGVSKDCIDYLRHRRKPGNTKGAAVRTRDPEEGPFTDAEFQAIFRALAAAEESGSIPIWAILLSKLLAACGGRPSQYAALKIKDFTPADPSTSPPAPAKLALPRIKTGHEHARVEFLECDLSARTAELMSAHIRLLIEGRGETQDSPLFPVSLLRLARTEDSSRPAQDLFFGHPTGANLSNFLARELDVLSIVSERTDFAPISLSPRRFRRTLATRLAEEGASKAVIADRLGHTDLQNVDVYFEASPSIVGNIDRAMGAALEPIALAFKGRIIGSEQQATFQGAPGTRIVDFRVSSTGIGSCAKGGGCALTKPVACYTCLRFEPWLDGPHEEVLRHLLVERERCADERIAGVNDDAITALQETIAECRHIRQMKLSKGAQ